MPVSLQEAIHERGAAVSSASPKLPIVMAGDVLVRCDGGTPQSFEDAGHMMLEANPTALRPTTLVFRRTPVADCGGLAPTFDAAVGGNARRIAELASAA